MFLRLEVIGNLGGDPEMRYTPGGDAVTSFSVASKKVWTDKSGTKHEKANWIRVSAWRTLAENCAKWLHKGDQVFVEGEAESRAWIDKGTGEAKSIIELTATNVRFLKTQNNGAAVQESGQTAPGASSTNEEDIPF